MTDSKIIKIIVCNRRSIMGFLTGIGTVWFVGPHHLSASMLPRQIKAYLREKIEKPDVSIFAAGHCMTSWGLSLIVNGGIRPRRTEHS